MALMRYKPAPVWMDFSFDAFDQLANHFARVSVQYSRTGLNRHLGPWTIDDKIWRFRLSGPEMCIFRIMDMDNRVDCSRIAYNIYWQISFPGFNPKLGQTFNPWVCPAHQSLIDQRTISYRNQETMSDMHFLWKISNNNSCNVNSGEIMSLKKGH